MKYKDPITGEYKTIHMKTSDTLPVGTIVSFEGDEIPEGYEEVIGEEARVVISPTEPTTGEEVWIQKGKNLFDIKGHYNLLGESTTYNVSGSTLTVSGLWYAGRLVNVEPNTDYTIKANISVGNIGIYGKDNKWIAGVINQTTFNTGSYEQIIIYFYTGGGGSTSKTATFTNIQIEQGTTATTYESYVDKKIYIKNDNDVYEEFYKNNGIVESGSNSNGSYAKFGDGTLIQRGFVNCNENGAGYVNYPVRFIDQNNTMTANNKYVSSSPELGIILTTQSDATAGGAVYFRKYVDGNLTIVKDTTIQANWIAIGRWK